MTHLLKAEDAPRPGTSNDRLLSLKTTAALTETSVALWRKLIARRLISVARIGRAVRIRQSDLTRFLAERERPS